MKNTTTTEARARWREVWQDARLNGGRVAWETAAAWIPLHRLACRCWVARATPTDEARRVAREIAAAVVRGGGL